MFLNGCAQYMCCCLAERYIWWDPEMSHEYVPVICVICDGDQQQEVGPFFQNMEGSSCVNLLATYQLIDLQSSIS